MNPPSSFIAVVAFGLFVGTFFATAASKSLAVFVVGLTMTLFITRAMIGD
jgi:hypothetical protein